VVIFLVLILLSVIGASRFVKDTFGGAALAFLWLSPKPYLAA
jgi:hypothetical protein